MASWLNDFEIKDRIIHVKSTGARLPLNSVIIREALAWFPFFLIEKVKRVGRINAPRPIIGFTPTMPRPWYMIWVAAHRANARLVSDLTTADAIFNFEDQTTTKSSALSDNLTLKRFNFSCTDISKSHVGTIFEQVFGYTLTVDPETYTRDMAVKSEINGRHDGRIETGPTARQDGLVYQKLIDNSVNDIWAEDLRCPIVGGEIALIFIKRRPLKTRFANMNSSVTLAVPEDHLSENERAKLKEFAAAMGLDWGGLDVLRDKTDGKIYVVDVNKTDMGPPISLPLKDKNTATQILSKQLLSLIANGRPRQ